MAIAPYPNSLIPFKATFFSSSSSSFLVIDCELSGVCCYDENCGVKEKRLVCIYVPREIGTYVDADLKLLDRKREQLWAGYKNVF